MMYSLMCASGCVNTARTLSLVDVGMMEGPQCMTGRLTPSNIKYSVHLICDI